LVQAFRSTFRLLYIQTQKIEGDWFQVIVNEDTDSKLWLKKSSDFKYLSWEEFILNTVSIIPINPKDNPLLMKPTNGSETINTPLLDCLSPVSINGEWLKVKVEPTVCDRFNEIPKNQIISGFVRWKRKNKLLINYYLVL